VGGIAPIDVAALAILGIAALRGMVLGLVRESFSLASLAVAYAAVLLYTRPFAAWLQQASSGRVGTLVAPWLAGAGILVLGIAGTVLLGRMGKRGARLAGLGWIDRAGGVVLGSAEGLLVVGIVLSIAGALLGSDHPAIAKARSVEAFRRFQHYSQSGEWPLPDVAAPHFLDEGHRR
jgi:membrane protein required for colicin V production